MAANSVHTLVDFTTADPFFTKKLTTVNLSLTLKRMAKLYDIKLTSANAPDALFTVYYNSVNSATIAV
jgi:hypothetical protein